MLFDKVFRAPAYCIPESRLMLIYSESAYELANQYAEFTLYLTQARWYFAGHFADDKKQYVGVFDSVRSTFKKLNAPYPAYPRGAKLIEQVDAILQKDAKLSSEDLGQIAKIMYTFIDREEKIFREEYFHARLTAIQREMYTTEFHNEVDPLLSSGKYDASIVAAFKFLDNQLQSALKVPATQYYGEDLANYAFAPNTGKLQLDTHANEQVGLRNFFSGANAVFRNPSAHRFMKFDQYSANAIISMVGMMSKLTKRLTASYKRKQKSSHGTP